MVGSQKFGPDDFEHSIITYSTSQEMFFIYFYDGEVKIDYSNRKIIFNDKHMSLYNKDKSNTFVLNGMLKDPGAEVLFLPIDIISSDVDLYDSEGNLVFQVPVQEIALAQVLEEVNPTEKFQTMIVGIIPYLIVFLIGLVAFWKAWQLLLKVLRQG